MRCNLGRLTFSRSFLLRTPDATQTNTSTTLQKRRALALQCDSHLQVSRHRVLQPGDGQPRKREGIPVPHLIVGNSSKRLLVLGALDGGGVRNGTERRGSSSSRAVPPEPCPAGNGAAEWQRHGEQAARKCSLCFLVSPNCVSSQLLQLAHCCCVQLKRHLDSFPAGLLRRDGLYYVSEIGLTLVIQPRCCRDLLSAARGAGRGLRFEK